MYIDIKYRCSKIFRNEEIEIIFVDNGSKDNTKDVLSKLIKQYPEFNFVKISKNKGYGYGIMFGLNKAKGNIIGWTHADLQTNPEDIFEGLNFFYGSLKEKIIV